MSSAGEVGVVTRLTMSDPFPQRMTMKRSWAANRSDSTRNM